MELLSNSMVEENSNLTLTKIRPGDGPHVEDIVVPKSILNLLYEIATINHDLKRKWKDVRKGIITHLLNNGCVTMTQFNECIKPFGNEYVRIVAINEVQFEHPTNQQKFSNYLLVYEQYLNDIEKESDPAHTNSNSIAKIKIKDSIAGY